MLFNISTLIFAAAATAAVVVAVVFDIILRFLVLVSIQQYAMATMTVVRWGTLITMLHASKCKYRKI